MVCNVTFCAALVANAWFLFLHTCDGSGERGVVKISFMLIVLGKGDGKRLVYRCEYSYSSMKTEYIILGQ